MSLAAPVKVTREIVLLRRECVYLGAPRQLVMRLCERQELEDLKNRQLRWLRTSRPSRW